ncbi:MAG: DUF1631 family protein [Burkholderiaceae bacterium]
MKVTEPEVSQQYTALYEATVQQAVGGAAALLTRLVAHVRAALRELEGKAMELRERDRLTDSRRRLNQFEATLCERFVEELMTAFARASTFERAQPKPGVEVHFDQLAAMGDAQLRHSLSSAQAQHTVQSAAEQALGELNRQVCALLGLSVVRLDHNPLRPAVYVEALTAAMAHLPVPSTVRQTWLSLMSGALGQELNTYYRKLSTHLRERGVTAAAAPTPPVPEMSPVQRAEASLLTLQRLRQLLATPAGDMAGDMAQRYDIPGSAGDGESVFAPAASVPTAFQATVPAAFDAAVRMKQTEQIAQRVQGRSAAPPASSEAARAREERRGAVQGLDQALGLEVVTLMVDNITHDARLLPPVQQLVAALEPALLQMALADPRFFSHKQHPARRLLHEITHRSVAYESTDSRGFSGFMEPLREAVAPLSAAPIETAEPFDMVLNRLMGVWDDPGAKEKRQLAKAIRALKQAEQRKALASIIVADIQARPDAALVPQEVLDFLCGPWAQVIAHARMSDKTAADDPGHYAELIEGLMWSAQPRLTRSKVAALTRLVPTLLGRLREGLATIDYPPHKTSGFFEVLMHLHQRGFRSDGAQRNESAPAKPRARPQREADDALWVAPQEARASNFIDLSTDPQPLQAPAATTDQLVEGAWVALMAEGNWTRTRLSWTSPNGTLLLFADALGYMQSLTRRACEQLMAQGHLYVIAMHPVEDALDAVAQTAMRNSVDVRF